MRAEKRRGEKRKAEERRGAIKSEKMELKKIREM